MDVTQTDCLLERIAQHVVWAKGPTIGAVLDMSAWTQSILDSISMLSGVFEVDETPVCVRVKNAWFEPDNVDKGDTAFVYCNKNGEGYKMRLKAKFEVSCPSQGISPTETETIITTVPMMTSSYECPVRKNNEDVIIGMLEHGDTQVTSSLVIKGISMSGWHNNTGGTFFLPPSKSHGPVDPKDIINGSPPSERVVHFSTNFAMDRVLLTQKFDPRTGCTQTEAKVLTKNWIWRCDTSVVFSDNSPVPAHVNGVPELAIPSLDVLFVSGIVKVKCGVDELFSIVAPEITRETMLGIVDDVIRYEHRDSTGDDDKERELAGDNVTKVTIDSVRSIVRDCFESFGPTDWRRTAARLGHQICSVIQKKNAIPGIDEVQKNQMFSSYEFKLCDQNSGNCLNQHTGDDFLVDLLLMDENDPARVSALSCEKCNARFSEFSDMLSFLVWFSGFMFVSPSTSETLEERLACKHPNSCTFMCLLKVSSEERRVRALRCRNCSRRYEEFELSFKTKSNVVLGLIIELIPVIAGIASYQSKNEFSNDIISGPGLEFFEAINRYASIKFRTLFEANSKKKSEKQDKPKGRKKKVSKEKTTSADGESSRKRSKVGRRGRRGTPIASDYAAGGDNSDSMTKHALDAIAHGFDTSAECQFYDDTLDPSGEMSIQQIRAKNNALSRDRIKFTPWNQTRTLVSVGNKITTQSTGMSSPFSLPNTLPKIIGEFTKVIPFSTTNTAASVSMRYRERQTSHTGAISFLSKDGANIGLVKYLAIGAVISAPHPGCFCPADLVKEWIGDQIDIASDPGHCTVQLLVDGTPCGWVSDAHLVRRAVWNGKRQGVIHFDTTVHTAESGRIDVRTTPGRAGQLYYAMHSHGRDTQALKMAVLALEQSLPLNDGGPWHDFHFRAFSQVGGLSAIALNGTEKEREQLNRMNNIIWRHATANRPTSAFEQVKHSAHSPPPPPPDGELCFLTVWDLCRNTRIALFDRVTWSWNVVEIPATLEFLDSASIYINPVDVCVRDRFPSKLDANYGVTHVKLDPLYDDSVASILPFSNMLPPTRVTHAETTFMQAHGFHPTKRDGIPVASKTTVHVSQVFAQTPIAGTSVLEAFSRMLDCRFVSNPTICWSSLRQDTQEDGAVINSRFDQCGHTLVKHTHAVTANVHDNRGIDTEAVSVKQLEANTTRLYKLMCSREIDKQTKKNEHEFRVYVTSDSSNRPNGASILVTNTPVDSSRWTRLMLLATPVKGDAVNSAVSLQEVSSFSKPLVRTISTPPTGVVSDSGMIQLRSSNCANVRFVAYAIVSAMMRMKMSCKLSIPGQKCTVSKLVNPRFLIRDGAGETPDYIGDASALRRRAGGSEVGPALTRAAMYDQLFIRHTPPMNSADCAQMIDFYDTKRKNGDASAETKARLFVMNSVPIFATYRNAGEGRPLMFKPDIGRLLVLCRAWNKHEWADLLEPIKAIDKALLAVSVMENTGAPIECSVWEYLVEHVHPCMEFLDSQPLTEEALQAASTSRHCSVVANESHTRIVLVKSSGGLDVHVAEEVMSALELVSSVFVRRLIPSGIVATKDYSRFGKSDVIIVDASAYRQPRDGSQLPTTVQRLDKIGVLRANMPMFSCDGELIESGTTTIGPFPMAQLHHTGTKTLKGVGIAANIDIVTGEPVKGGKQSSLEERAICAIGATNLEHTNRISQAAPTFAVKCASCGSLSVDLSTPDRELMAGITRSLNRPMKQPYKCRSCGSSSTELMKTSKRAHIAASQLRSIGLEMRVRAGDDAKAPQTSGKSSQAERAQNLRRLYKKHRNDVTNVSITKALTAAEFAATSAIIAKSGISSGAFSSDSPVCEAANAIFNGVDVVVRSSGKTLSIKHVIESTKRVV